MPRTGKGQKALDRALKHREDIERLLATTPRWMLRGWFLDWAESQLRRDRFYLFSEDEHAVLAKELSSRMTPCEGWDGYTVDQLVHAALSYRADCGEEDDELLTILQRERPSELPLWLMRRLVGICHVAGLSVPTATRAAIRASQLIRFRDSGASSANGPGGGKRRSGMISAAPARCEAPSESLTTNPP